MIRANTHRPPDDNARRGKDEHSLWRARRGATAAVATIAGISVLAAMPLASSAGAATVPAIPAVNVAALDGALASAPGVTPAQIQALQSDLAALQAGQPVPNLTGDINAIVTAIGQASGETPLLTPVLNSVAEIADGLLGGNVSALQLQGLIDQLETVSGTSGVLPTVGGALAQLAAALSGADLSGLLGQAGSPLSSQDVQTIISELESLQSLPADATIPAGALSGVAQALDTVAGAPNVPADAASALEGVAGALNSASGVTPAVLSSVLPALASSLPSVQSVPVTGPALGSLVGALTDELATSPPATAGSGGVGGSGGAAGGAGAAGSSTTTTPNYVTYLQSNSAQQASVKIGASIHKVAFSGGKLHVKMTCPAVLAGGCKTTIHLTVRSWNTGAKTVTIAAGKTRTVLVGLPQFATTAAKHGQAITVTATTGAYTTHKHTIHIKFKKH